MSRPYNGIVESSKCLDLYHYIRLEYYVILEEFNASMIIYLDYKYIH